jgi:putative ABC transport system substrate-binding protein
MFGRQCENRRGFIAAAAAGAALGWPLAARAQPLPAKVSRIGYLATAPLESREARQLIDALLEGLREHGYVEGRNIVIEFRSADAKVERFPDLAAELVRLKVDVIVSGPTAAARAAQRATATIPIVAPTMGDPVGDRLVASLARPGGNVTGLTFLGPELTPKRLALLKEALPAASRFAAFWHPAAFAERVTQDMVRAAETAARSLGVLLRFVRIEAPAEIERGFATMAQEPTDAVIVFPSPMLFSERRPIAALAARHRLPAMTNAREWVELGCLIAYGANILDLHRRASNHVAKILKGAKPADLPVEQPTKFELVVNMKTAKALGITVPQSILVQADEVIE